MKRCDDFADDVSAYVEGRLPFGKRFSLWVHQAMCVSCRTYVRQMSFVRQAASRLRSTDEPDPKVVDELAESFPQAHN